MPHDNIPDPFQLEDSDEDTTSESESENTSPPQRSLTTGLGRVQPGRPPVSGSNSGLQSPLPQDVPLGSPAPVPPGIFPLPGSRVPSGSVDGRSLPAIPQTLEEQQDVPALFLPGLVSPSLFLPIPNTDQLATLLNKYITPEVRPVRDLSGTWQHADLHSLVMTNSWRALARMARDRLVDAPADDLPLIFDLWYLRLSSLVRLRLHNQASAECTNLFNVLFAIQPVMIQHYVLDTILPFELEVMFARTKYWSGDPYGYLDELYVLIAKSKKRSRAAQPGSADEEMWKERAVRVGLIMASQLLEMKDHTAATSLLLPLCRTPPPGSDEPGPSPALLSSIARVYLDAGDIDSAQTLFQRAADDPNCEETMKEINRALLASSKLDWPTAVEELQKAVAREPDNSLVANNLAVALLSVGRIDEGIRHMEAALGTSPSVVGNVEPFLFNLATLYELRTAASYDKKCELLLEVAKWAGDGLRATCLKLPPV
ncbi:hypothetical protein M407DRAFT_240765 [Tulasnella calospora MUT 4182]|uniref:Uncharacterized protein n=1 Tax=Tulasnella calospora MUT 4182 TaxID=1051891 RepID=A0A0C3QMG7_9AGAM|nr:hypothetical protein M407DRAFT_240765 [Tulasnella calospora MUT 4182]